MRTSIRKAASVLFLVIASPAISGYASHLIWLVTDGEKRCFEGLDTSTPGLICAPGLNLITSIIISALVLLLIFLPLSLWLSNRPRAYLLVSLALALATMFAFLSVGTELIDVIELVSIPFLLSLLSFVFCYRLWPNNSFKPSPHQGGA
jgi:hypothetical protein